MHIRVKLPKGNRVVTVCLCDNRLTTCSGQKQLRTDQVEVEVIGVCISFRKFLFFCFDVMRKKVFVKGIFWVFTISNKWVGTVFFLGVGSSQGNIYGFGLLSVCLLKFKSKLKFHRYTGTYKIITPYTPYLPISYIVVQLLRYYEDYFSI